jgi:hypothetical protein
MDGSCGLELLKQSCRTTRAIATLLIDLTVFGCDVDVYGNLRTLTLVLAAHKHAGATRLSMLPERSAF